MGAILLGGTLAFAPVLSQADEIPPPEDDELSTPKQEEVVPDEEEELAPIDDNPYARNGIYVGLAGAVGVDVAAKDELENQLRARVDVKEAIGLQFHLGYRFHPRIAAEYQFEWITDADIDIEGVPFGTAALKLERWTNTANAKAYLGTGSVQPFLLVGLGLMHVEVDGSGVSEKEHGFAARFGGGLEVYATEHIVIDVNASYVLPAGDVDDFDYVSVGWGFLVRF